MTPLSDLRRIAEAANNALSTTAGHEFCHAFSPAECLRLLDEIDLLQGDVALLRAAIIQRRDWDEREPLIKTPTMTTLSDLRR